jgi:hypothetical protein
MSFTMEFRLTTGCGLANHFPCQVGSAWLRIRPVKDACTRQNKAPECHE